MNANDFFYELDGIDKPKARRNEGGFTLGGPIRRDKFFFFGGYQRTQAETGFVPTASSITVLPAALGLIRGRSHQGEPACGVPGAEPELRDSVPASQCLSPTDTAASRTSPWRCSTCATR